MPVIGPNCTHTQSSFIAITSFSSSSFCTLVSSTTATLHTLSLSLSRWVFVLFVQSLTTYLSGLNAWNASTPSGQRRRWNVSRRSFRVSRFPLFFLSTLALILITPFQFDRFHYCDCRFLFLSAPVSDCCTSSLRFLVTYWSFVGNGCPFSVEQTPFTTLHPNAVAQYTRSLLTPMGEWAKTMSVFHIKLPSSSRNSCSCAPGSPPPSPTQVCRQNWLLLKASACSFSFLFSLPHWKYLVLFWHFFCSADTGQYSSKCADMYN